MQLTITSPITTEKFMDLLSTDGQLDLTVSPKKTENSSLWEMRGLGPYEGKYRIIKEHFGDVLSGYDELIMLRFKNYENVTYNKPEMSVLGYIIKGKLYEFRLLQKLLEDADDMVEYFQNVRCRIYKDNADRIMDTLKTKTKIKKYAGKERYAEIARYLYNTPFTETCKDSAMNVALCCDGFDPSDPWAYEKCQVGESTLFPTDIRIGEGMAFAFDNELDDFDIIVRYLNDREKTVDELIEKSVDRDHVCQTFISSRMVAEAFKNMSEKQKLYVSILKFMKAKRYKKVTMIYYLGKEKVTQPVSVDFDIDFLQKNAVFHEDNVILKFWGTERVSIAPFDDVAEFLVGKKVIWKRDSKTWTFNEEKGEWEAKIYPPAVLAEKEEQRR